MSQVIVQVHINHLGYVIAVIEIHAGTDGLATRKGIKDVSVGDRSRTTSVR
jgi:hypothetical protein